MQLILLLHRQTVTKEINPFHIQSVNPLHDIAEEDVDSDQNTDITHAHDDVVETHDADQTELMTRMMMEEHNVPRIEGITDIDLSDLEQDLFNGSTNGNSDELEIELDELPSILSNHHQYLDTTHDRIQSTVDVQLSQTNLHKSTSWTTTVNHQLDSEYSPHAQFQTSIGSNRSAPSTHSQGWIPLHTQHAHTSSRSSHDVSETGQTLNHNHPIQNIHNSVQPLQYVDEIQLEHERALNAANATAEDQIKLDMRQEMALGRKELQKTYQQEIDNEAAKAEELKTRLKTVCDERDAALQNAIELKRQMTEKVIWLLKLMDWFLNEQNARHSISFGNPTSASIDALKRAHMAELAQTKVTLEASLSMAKSDEEN
ncbi:hypothetical protein BSLG_005616 [Batrachochytrium salamandrivorans]|nr:hypothetical protein BSLG_005616 [Batrachochytrium salamandrivorans]